jgi:DNA-binding MarR family transcriptional regulator
VSWLVEEGYAGRRPSETDGRSPLVEISDKGRDILLADRRRRDAWLARKLKDLSPEERELLRGIVPLIEKLATS